MAISPLQPSILSRADERLGIGHYQPHVTHHLEFVDPLEPDERKKRDPRDDERKNCNCPMLANAPNMVGSSPLELEKAVDTFGRSDQFTLRLTDERRRRGWDVNSPYYVIEAEPKIMAEHSDIFNPYFVSFLTHFMGAYNRKYERLQEEELKRAELAQVKPRAVDKVCDYYAPLNTIVGGGAPASAAASVNP